LSQFLGKMNAKDHRGVIAAYKDLPLEMQRHKMVLMMRHVSAQQLADEAELIATIEDLKANYPTDPCVAFISIDLHSMRREFPEAKKAIDALDFAVGGDPYLQLMRAIISIDAENFDQAIVEAKRGLQRDPNLDAGYYTIAFASQSKGDFVSVAAALKSLAAIGKITPAEVEASPNYAPFVASPEFKAWKAEFEAKR
jgi:predicted Zn-dependent protease